MLLAKSPQKGEAGAGQTTRLFGRWRNEVTRLVSAKVWCRVLLLQWRDGGVACVAIHAHSGPGVRAGKHARARGCLVAVSHGLAVVALQRRRSLKSAVPARPWNWTVSAAWWVGPLKWGNVG